MSLAAPDLAQEIRRIMREDRGRLLAALIRSLGDFDLAEDAPGAGEPRSLASGGAGTPAP